ncbi:GNAT family N-acetyltransferase [Arthrobacter castelli]|uniref:GNAT family N-acetyltransferase n=1 Tax=Arthrobacter castelli TaxID=271431 RepID=UPI0009D716AF|nr:GNAT family N-acetyltransferase [Arthrobacter castelli]
MAPWLSPAARPQPASRHPPAADPVRPLDHGDTGRLRTLVNRDPVANIFLASHLETTQSAAPTAAGGHVLGYFEGPELTAAAWSGANIVPVEAAGRPAKAFGRYLVQTGKSFSSIFGPASAVLPLWTELESVAPAPFDVRRNQPLMALSAPPAVEPHPGLRFSTMDDFESLLPACVAMFEEEVGYSPMIGGQAHYKQRIASFIHRSHSMVDYDDDGQVVFKAELGSVSSQVTQIQGVWMNPKYRGRGLSAPYLAAVVELAQQHATTTSLYVNDYNAPAMASYVKVGFERVGTFATVLF